MKIFVAATLFFVGFAVTTVAGDELLNGGQILSADGKYIPGILIEQWGPLFEEIRSYVEPGGVGYLDIQQQLKTDTNEAVETQNGRLLQLLYKVFGQLFEKQIPYIQNEQLQAIYVQAVEGNKQQEEQLKRGNFDLDSINEFFTAASNGLNNFLNSQRQ